MPVASINTTKLVRLSELNNNLSSVIEFSYDEEDNRRSLFGSTGQAVARTGVTAAAGAAGVYGGALANKAIQRSGGYAANLAAGKAAFTRGAAGTGLQNIAKGPGRSIGQGLGMALSKLKTLLPSLKLSSKESEIKLDEHILEPWGDQPKTKIIDEQFPAGLSPAAALKFPFPKLMRYLNQKEMYRQQFSKQEKLIELKVKTESLIHGS